MTIRHPEGKLFPLILASGLASGILYMNGYMYLRGYFSNFGELIPLNSIFYFEIILIGLFPAIFVGLPVLCLIILLNKIPCYRKRRVFKWIVGSIIVIYVYISLVPTLGDMTFKKDLSYNTLLPTYSENKIPVVEVIYTTPLGFDTKDFENINKNKGSNPLNDNDDDILNLNVSEITMGTKLFFKYTDKPFFENNTDYFKSRSKLYFETADNYYLSLLSNPFELIGSETITILHTDQGIIERKMPFTFGGIPKDKDENKPFELIVLPKKNVESIKYESKRS